MNPLAAILSILTGVAGWYYLFFSKAADQLADLEDQRLNRRRNRLRRVGGGVMLLLAVGLYVGFYAADDRTNPWLFVIVWSAVMILIVLLVVLALLDVRLTYRLRANRLRLKKGNLLDRDGPSRSA
jgi:hypothetical protein